MLTNLTQFMFDKRNIIVGKDCTALRNRTTVITRIYDYIPENIIVYSTASIILIFVFSLIRYQKDSLDSDVTQESQHQLRHTSNRNARRKPPPHLYSNFYNYHRSQKEFFHEAADNSATIQQVDYTIPKGLFGWMKFVFTVTDDQLHQQAGPDAMHYLSFQRHLMIIIGITTGLAIFIILPVNFFMGQHYKKNEFGRTTMDNLATDSNWLWVHVVIIIIYVPLITCIMQDCSGNRSFAGSYAIRTLLIKNIAKKHCSETFIKTQLLLTYPDLVIEKIQLAYNYKSYLKCYKQYESTRSARMYLEEHLQMEDTMIRQRFCSCNKKVNAYQYYKEEEEQLLKKLREKIIKFKQNPIGMAFVTLSSANQVKFLINTFQNTKNIKWSLCVAPQPGDIVWENLRLTTPLWYLTWISVNSILFVALFFLATPVIILGLAINAMKSTNEFVVPGFWLNALPVLLLCLFSSLMPTIIELTDCMLCYYTLSNTHYWTMLKIFLYLIFMILFLPTLGFQSLEALLDSIIKMRPMHWHCIFRPNRGAFFVNFTIVEALLFNSLDLLRVFPLLVYSIKLLGMKCRAEVPYIRKNMFRVFPFGKHYAWTTFFFTMCIVYSIFSPLIMPAALFYITIKHFVDRYNLFFSFAPSNMISHHGGKLHTVAVKMTICCIITLKLFMVMIFASVKDLGRAAVILTSLVVSLIFFPIVMSIREEPRTISDVNTVGSNYVPRPLQNEKLSYT